MFLLSQVIKLSASPNAKLLVTFFIDHSFSTPFISFVAGPGEIPPEIGPGTFAGGAGGLFVSGDGAKARDFTFMLGADIGTVVGGDVRRAGGGVTGGRVAGGGVAGAGVAGGGVAGGEMAGKLLYFCFPSQLLPTLLLPSKKNSPVSYSSRISSDSQLMSPSSPVLLRFLCFPFFLIFSPSTSTC